MNCLARFLLYFLIFYGIMVYPLERIVLLQRIVHKQLQLVLVKHHRITSSIMRRLSFYFHDIIGKFQHIRLILDVKCFL